MVGPRRFLLSGLAVLAFAGTAIAADVPARPIYTKAPPAFSWDGWYIGAHGGYAFGKSDLTTLAGFEGLDPAGGFGGLQLGYMRHLTPNWVLGFEVDASFGDVSDGRVSVDYFGTARTRVGYATGPWLLYATGGAAWAWSEVGVVGGSGHELAHAGWTVGAGLEYAFAPRWSARLEYLYLDLDTVRTTRGAANVVNDLSFSLIRFGLNYRFGEIRSVQAHAFPERASVRYATNWTGVYIGVHGGYAAGTQDLSPFVGAAVSLDQRGWLGGVQSGANWQFAPNWLIGVEGDTSFGSIDDAAFGAFVETRTFGTVRGRFGYVANNWLFYGTAGAAWAQTIGFVPADTSFDRFQLGWTAGVGVEYMLSERWSAKLEYLYADFSANRSVIGGNPESQRSDLNIVRIGLNYRASLFDLLNAR